MINNIKERTLFEGVGGKEMEAGFGRTEDTTGLGFLLFGEVEHRILLIERAESVIRYAYRQDCVKHRLKEMLKQQFFRIICGCEDGDDCGALP